MKNKKNQRTNPLSQQVGTSPLTGRLNKGFTLIELIVSITIIAVMTVVAAVSFGGVGRKSRDAKRMADLEKIRMALEMVKQQGNGSTYPANTSSLVPTYIQTLPKDPKTAADYTYTRVTNYTYTIQATVEDAGSSNVAGGIYRLSNP